jgi:maleylacetoacetate isomerase/maleylpyruvate isomerase
MALTVYGYWRSSASWRVRWALAHKGLPYDYVPVNLLKGEHRSPENLARNPSGFVPSLRLEDGKSFLAQSMAIVNYLEEKYPQNSRLFPADPLAKAQVISLCEIINADTAPLQKPSVAKFHGDTDEKRNAWVQHWIREGLGAFDRASQPLRGTYSFSDQVSAADMFLIPQVYNALRYKIDVAQEFPALHKIYERCLSLEACQKSSPESQLDAAP